MVAIFDRVKVYLLTRGVGAAICGPAVTGYLGFADYGVPSGTLVSYLINDVGGAWEVGYGSYINNFVARDQLLASSTGDFLNLSGNAILSCQPAAKDYT